jgi:hypothetical protein
MTNYDTAEYRKIHQESREEFNRVQSAQYDEREQALIDRRFYSIPGAQWENEFGEQFENKPKLEVNKVHNSVIRIISEYRNNRITVDFVPRDGEPNDELTDFLDGLYRADEDKSTATEAYDNAFEEAVAGGYGGWRLRAEYEDEYDPENEKQCIVFEPIYDYDSTVYWDLEAQRQDKSDAKKCWVLHPYTRQGYIEEFDDDPSTWDRQVNKQEFDWDTPDYVYVAEYYACEEAEETLKIYTTLDGEEEVITEEELDEETEKRLLYSGAEFSRERKVKKKKVHKYLMSGNGILEDCGYVAGDIIPVVPNFGKRWVVDSIERAMGHVRIQKDAQRLSNSLRSWLAEIAALSPKEKPIFTQEQMAGHWPMWTDDNVKNYPALLVNELTDANGNIAAVGPVAYTKVPNIPPAMAALLQISEQDLKDLAGNQENGEKIVSNMSGKAVELIQNRLDMMAMIYMDNMAKAIKRCGEIWLAMAKAVYVEESRKMKTIGPDGTTGTVELSKPYMNPETGEIEYKNDLSKADCEVSVQVGPSSDSRRAATVKALTQMMQISSDPETIQVLGSMAMMNMEGEGIDDVRDYFRRKLIKFGATKPTDKEAEELMKELENQPPNAEEEYLKSAAGEADAKAAESRADTIKTIKEAEKTEAQTAEIYAGIDRDDYEAMMRTKEAFSEVRENLLKMGREEQEIDSIMSQYGDRPTIEMGERTATIQP